jgi:hypothetical protein
MGLKDVAGFNCGMLELSYCAISDIQGDESHKLQASSCFGDHLETPFTSTEQSEGFLKVASYEPRAASPGPRNF